MTFHDLMENFKITRCAFFTLTGTFDLLYLMLLPAGLLPHDTTLSLTHSLSQHKKIKFPPLFSGFPFFYHTFHFFFVFLQPAKSAASDFYLKVINMDIFSIKKHSTTLTYHPPPITKPPLLF